MALKVENASAGKIIGIGAETILPGESKVIPKKYEQNPMLNFYEEKGFLKVTEAPDDKEYFTSGQVMNALDRMKPDVDDSEAAEESAPDAEDAAETLRKARLASLNSLDETALGKLAGEVGVNPADCKDMADMKKKVRAALKK